MNNVYDYLIARYGKENYQPNLYMMIEELQNKVKVLEENMIVLFRTLRGWKRKILKLLMFFMNL
jgi:hypothetical protein